MKTSIKSIIILLALGFLTNCKDNSTNPPDNSNGIIPLKIGNYWINKTTEHDSSGVIKATSYDTSRIISSINLSGRLYYSTETHLFVFNSSDGFCLKDTSDLSIQFLIYKYPGNVGDKFLQFLMTDTTTIESINFEYTIPVGKFTCYVYNTGNYQYEYLSPSVGVVAKLEYDTTKYGYKFLSSKTELFEYHLN